MLTKHYMQMILHSTLLPSASESYYYFPIHKDDFKFRISVCTAL